MREISKGDAYEDGREGCPLVDKWLTSGKDQSCISQNVSFDVVSYPLLMASSR